MSFLKEAFNFCVSGYATNWYYYGEGDKDQLSLLKSFKILIKYHWGSVVGGSLVLALLYYVDLFFDFIYVFQLIIIGPRGLDQG